LARKSRRPLAVNPDAASTATASPAPGSTAAPQSPPLRVRRAPSRWTSRRIATWILAIVGVLSALGLVIHSVGNEVWTMFLDSQGNPHLTPLLSNDAAAQLLQTARATLRGEPAPAGAPANGVIGAVVATYGEHGPREAAGCFGDDARKAVICAAEKLRKGAGEFGASPADKVSLHLLRSLRSAKPVSLRDKGWGYSRGLYSVLLVDGESAHLFTDVQMHVLGLHLPHALAELDEKRGVRMSGEAPKDGAYVLPTESWTEYEGQPVALYRASTIMPPPDAKTIMEYTALAGDYLTRIQKDDDTWLYEGDIGRDHYGKTYNLLRHAGTVYALYELFEATGAPRYREAADKGWTWLLDQLERENDVSGRECAFPVERHTVTLASGKKHTSYTVKLGGAGLTLVALSERLKVAPNEPDLELGKAVARHILRSQNPDGSFQHYWAYKTKKAKERRSEYYPGEAMLGLIRFYQIDPDPTYLEAMERAAHYAIHERWEILGYQFYVPLDAWFSVALNELDKVQPRKDYVDYCLLLTDMEINDQMNRKWEIFYPDYDGGYWPYPPSAGAAGSRGEGVTACYEAAHRAGRDVTALKKHIREAARFQLERLVRPEFAHLYPNPQRALGAIRGTPVANSVRIDNNQHNISSLLVEAKILSE